MDALMKEKILLAHNWEFIDGYAMDFSPPDADNVIISVEEIKKIIGKPSEKFWFVADEYDYARDLESAWECFLDDYAGLNDLDMTDEQLEKRLEEEWSNK